MAGLGAALVAGLYAALSPIWVSTTHEGGAVASLIILGALPVVTSVAALARASVAVTQWLIALWGVLLFVAPWVITYHSAQAEPRGPPGSSASSACWACFLA